MKRFFSVLFCLLLISLCLPSCTFQKSEVFSVVATNFPAYDFAKNIIGDKGTVRLLLPPGGESHTYEPTAKDIILISECDLFIYNGGESDSWVETLLSSLDTKPKTVKMIDYVDVCHEEHTEEHHSEHHHQFDEHIWTSLKNSVKIINGISDKLSSLDKNNLPYYTENAESYASKIEKLDADFEELFNRSKRKTIVVADRFPFTHFINDYNLHYYSAYHSCSEDAEPTPKIIAELIDVVKSEKIPVIFHLEFSNKTVASAVSEDTKTPLKELHSCHNVTKKQLAEGITYLDLMKHNFEILKEAVN